MVLLSQRRRLDVGRGWVEGLALAAVELTRAALAAARHPAEETHALTVGNLVKEDTDLVIPIAASVAFDPAGIDACLVLACLARRGNKSCHPSVATSTLTATDSVLSRLRVPQRQVTTPTTRLAALTALALSLARENARRPSMALTLRTSMTP